MENSEKALEIIAETTLKNLVFAAFSKLKLATIENEKTFSVAVGEMRKDPLFRALKEGGCSMPQAKEIFIKALEKNQTALKSKFEKMFDLAINENFAPLATEEDSKK